jgi:hypothetical protein
MRKTLTILLLICSLTASAHKWYIATTGSDTHGKGTIADPWLTLHHAADTVLFSGDTIVVGVGTFNESTNRIDVNVGVSIMGAGATSVIISTYVGTSYTNASISLESATEGTDGCQSISYIKLQGSSLTAKYGISVMLRDSVKIHHVTIEDFLEIGIAIKGATTAGNEPTTYATGNQIYNCTITNSATRSGLINVSGQDGILIHDNTLTSMQRAAGHDSNILTAVYGYNKNLKYYNNTSYQDRVALPAIAEAIYNIGLELWDGTGGNEIYDNTFNGGHCQVDVGGTTNVKGASTYSYWIHDNLFQWSAQYATQTDGSFCGVGFEGGVLDLIIEKNYFKNLPDGIGSSIMQASRTHKNIRISYNVFENLGWGDDVWSFGFFINNLTTDGVVRDINVYNNTFVSGTAGISTAAVWMNSNGDISNIKIRNNIMQGFGTYGAIAYFDYDDGTIDSIYVQNNSWYNNADTVYYRGSRTVSNEFFSGNSTANPLLVSATNLRLQSASPAINAGIDIGLTSDYSGFAKYGAAWDIGAYEYGQRYLKNGGKLVMDDEHIVTIIR